MVREESRNITADPVDVYISHFPIYGDHLYRVIVDGLTFDQFMSSKPMTISQTVDVSNSYRDALMGYRSPC